MGIVSATTPPLAQDTAREKESDQCAMNISKTISPNTPAPP
jgi:hypothetical protein